MCSIPLGKFGMWGTSRQEGIQALYCRYVTSASCPFSIAMSLLMQVSKLSEYFISY